MPLKNKLLYSCILFLSYSHAIAQGNTISVITYISEVPLIIESNLFVDKLAKENVLHAVSGKVRIALAPRTTAILSDIYVRAGKPLPIRQNSNIEYRWVFNTKVNTGWKAIPNRITELEKFPYAGQLLDTTLQANDHLILQFRFRQGNNILQQNIFSRPELIPFILRYRQKNLYDSIDNRIKARIARDKKEKWPGFDTMKQNTIYLLPGKFIEFVLKNHSLNKDSCILYRLYKKEKEPDQNWKLTGHLFTPTGMESKNEYLLNIRYTGMDVCNTYRILVQPFWYETPVATTIFIILTLFAIPGIPYLLYRYLLRLERRKRIRIQKQLLNVQSQLNPHFVYNALSSIEALVTNKENDRANEYLSAFSDIMRETLRNSNLLFISLAEDTGMLEKYISIEQLRFEFRCIIEIDPQLDLDTIEFPPMLLQPAIENAVKHGVSGMGSLGLITLSFLKKEKDLIITVRDNGKMKAGKNSQGNGLGISFTQERIKNLKKLFKKEKIDFRILHSEEGTLVTFHFQNWL